MSSAPDSTPTVLIAPDSFKGTFSAHAAAELIGEGIREVMPDAAVTLAPMADGGEGTATCFAGDTITLPSLTADGRLAEASYVFAPAERTAYIDVAAASGLTTVRRRFTAGTNDTFGTGVLIADALSRGARRIVLALGGSATTDGGTGILSALGARWLTTRGVPAPHGGSFLNSIASVDTAKLNPQLAGVEFVLLTDVTAPATGPNGAAHVFGPQKGADPETVEELDEGLAHLCSLLEVNPERPGMGAAGGVPIAISWLGELLGSPASIVAGAPAVADAVGVTELLPEADLVVTGEGALDAQSLQGKVVGHLAEQAARHGVSVGVVAGRIDDATVARLERVLPQLLVTALPEPSTSPDNVRKAGAEIARHYRSISSHQG